MFGRVLRNRASGRTVRGGMLILCGIFFCAPLTFAQDGSGESPSDPENTTTIVSVSGGEPDRPAMELSLDDAIRMALRHNLDLQVQRVTEERSRRDRRIANAAFDPLFRTNYTLGRFRQPSVSFLDFGSNTSTITVNAFASDSWSMGVSGILETGTQYSVTAGGTCAWWAWSCPEWSWPAIPAISVSFMPGNWLRRSI